MTSKRRDRRTGRCFARSAGSRVTLMNARAAGQNVGRRTTRMNVRIQPELFAQNAGRKKCQETRLYLKKRNEHRLGAGRSYARELGRWHTSSLNLASEPRTP